MRTRRAQHTSVDHGFSSALQSQTICARKTREVKGIKAQVGRVIKVDGICSTLFAALRPRFAFRSRKMNAPIVYRNIPSRINRGRVSFTTIALAVVAAFPIHAGEIARITSVKPDLFKPIASLTNFGLYQSSPFFSGQDKAWLETSLRLGGRFEYESLAFEAVGLGLRTTGSDPYGSGHTPQFDFDTLYLQWNQTSGGLPFKLTVGRQPITIGTQFLIGDGVYDGFHPDYTQAVYHNPRRSFDAARLEFDAATLHFDTLVYSVHPTWDAGGERNGTVSGTEVSRAFTTVKSSYAAGVFYRDSPSNLDNDMWLLTLRGEQHCPRLEDLYVSGEWVGEFGRGNNAYYVTTPGQSLHEYGWHLELGWQAEKLPLKPFAEAGYVYYSADFTPVATGFSDWGKWYLGNQIDWIIFGTNSRVMRAQAGFWPHEKVKLRAQYHQTRLVSGPNGPLSDEVSVIAEWFANDRLWVNALLGYSMPHDALAASGLTNPFSYLNAGAVPVGNKPSVDFVLAVGINF
jgi:hypothetical protein